jgi:hypothetical protein
MQYKITRLLALIIGIESSLVMAGWILNIEPLTRILPSGINMKFPTALIFFLSAWGLYFISESIENNDEHIRKMLLVITLAVFFTMILLLISNLLGIQTSIEKLFLVQQNSVNAFGAGSPSLPTTINFILFGLASSFSFFPSYNRAHRLKFFGYPILLIGLIPIFGYILHIPTLYYQFSPAIIPMALNTAVSFVLLGLGLIIVNSK